MAPPPPPPHVAEERARRKRDAEAQYRARLRKLPQVTANVEMLRRMLCTATVHEAALPRTPPPVQEEAPSGLGAMQRAHHERLARDRHNRALLKWTLEEQARLQSLVDNLLLPLPVDFDVSFHGLP